MVPRTHSGERRTGFPDNVMSATPPPGDFSRPLCPWPKTAHWTGRGSKTDASSFVCARADRERDDEDDDDD